MENMKISGRFNAVCKNQQGEVKWKDKIDNLVTTEGKTALLEQGLSGANYTGTCYMALIASGSAPVVGDTMSSHAGWVEAGSSAPLYSARLPLDWSSAAGGVKSTANTCDFTIITTGGNAVGAMVAFNGAVDVNANTDGTLYSAGLFSGGAKTLAVGDVLQVTYSTTLS